MFFPKPSMASFLLIISLFLVSLSSVKPDLASEKTALLTLQGAIGKKYLRWNITQPTPCTWQGVECNDNHVTILRLPGNRLSGQIPSGIFGNLTHLRILSLRLNTLSGLLPNDLASCTELRNLYVQNNQFSGQIPKFLFGFNKLVRLNLAGNYFSGVISPAFSDLTRLQTLYLEYNQLSGSIPELKLPNIIQFNVSFNHLIGPIPSSLQTVPSNAFQGNILCGLPLGSCH